MDPNLIQLNVRRSAEDLQDYLRDLNSWEEEIKHKDKLLTEQKPILKKKLPPVRSKKKKADAGKSTVSSSTDEKKAKLQQSRISSYDYSSWDKFDVDAACEAIEENTNDSPEEDTDGSEDEEIQEERRKQLAVLEKERGNKLFKEGKHEAAVERYTRAMELDPTNAVFPANRAMALLKLERFAVAEEDCSLSLSLDQTYLKAWLRRATTREKLDKLTEAKQDFEKVLEMEAGNKLAKSGLVSIKQKLAALSQSKTSDPVSPPTGPYVYPVKRPPHLRSKKPMKRITIEEIGGVSELLSTQVLVQNPLNKSPVSESSLLANDDLLKEERISNMNSLSLEAGGKPVDNDLQTKRPVTMSRSDRSSSPCPGDVVVTSNGDSHSSQVMLTPEPATNSILFQSHWKSLKKNRSLLAKYFQSISPSSYPTVLQQSLETSTFSEILSILEEHYVRMGKTCLEEMKWLTKVPRFQVAVLFLNRTDKQVMKNIFSGLGELLSSANAQQELSTLAKSFSISLT